MATNFKNINEATLWDNLKRKANEDLRKIQSKNKNEVLLAFNEKYPKKIQRLLKTIGKEFFKIFLHETLKNNGKATINSDIQKRYEEIIADFKFYFWPGYTTLSGRRIVVTGENKGPNIDDDFLTGIGNNHLKLRDSDKLKDFLITDNSLVNSVFSYSGSFWIRDIPSTVAFDKVLNQKYIDKMLGDSIFKVPSTHLWKSMQKRENNDFIPMPLMDGSELRILEISVGKETIVSGNNMIKVSIPINKLNECGGIIYKKLGRDRIPIKWENFKDRMKYNEWPLTNSSTDNNDAQIAAYSFWLSETLNFSDNSTPNYDKLRDTFKRANLQILGESLTPFQEFHKSFFKPHKLTKIHYNYWYTSFMESYDPLMDLGSAMFFTSHQYNSKFIIRCTNWLRWIYNELRILEAIAKEEVERKRSLSHSLTGALSAYKRFTDTRIAKRRLKNHDKETYQLLFNRINSLFIADSLKKNEETNIDLINEVSDILNMYRIISEDQTLFNNIFEGLAQKDEIYKRYVGLPFIHITGDKVIISSDINLIGLLLKDQIENLIKHSNVISPYCSICVKERLNTVQLIFTNSNIPSNEVLKLMKNEGFPGTKQGWNKSKKIIGLLKGKINIEAKDTFSIKIILKK